MIIWAFDAETSLFLQLYLQSEIRRKLWACYVLPSLLINNQYSQQMLLWCLSIFTFSSSFFFSHLLTIWVYTCPIKGIKYLLGFINLVEVGRQRGPNDISTVLMCEIIILSKMKITTKCIKTGIKLEKIIKIKINWKLCLSWMTSRISESLLLATMFYIIWIWWKVIHRSLVAQKKLKN